MRTRVVGLSLCAALTAATRVCALAQEPMSGAEFDAYVTGSTVTYAHDGNVYGMEQYLPGHKVLWRHNGGDCIEGSWFETGDRICFQYEDGVPLQCWQFFNDGTRLGARSDADPEGLWLYEVRKSPEPMTCPAPYLGS